MKSIFTSKTFWVNTLSLIAIITQGITGKEIVSVELQAGILSFINIILRTVTKEPVSWK
jgi:uncharacterized membrane protein